MRGRDWWKSRVPTTPGAEPWSVALDTRDWPLAPATLGHWDDWGVPALVGYAGMVWYRTSIDLTAEQAVQAAQLSLGPVEKVDETWVNGAPVGGTADSNQDRVYELPAGTLHAGKNIIAVNVLNLWAFGGMVGPAERQALHFQDGTAVSLAAGWRYQVVPLSVGRPAPSPADPLAGLSMAYNGMIAPIGPFAFKASSGIKANPMPMRPFPTNPC